mgnify:CR=1 FL=1
MTPRELCAGGAAEGTKLAAHVLLLGMAGVCLTYNLSAWLLRRESHLAMNAVVYATLVGFEAMKIRHHWRQ